MKITHAVALFLLAAIIAGCGNSQTTTRPSPTPDWIVAEAPTGDVGISHAKQHATEGENIVVKGRIGGRRDPINTDSATFILVDVAIPSCADNPGDNCPTPWDYCCEPSEIMLAGTATVQVVDETGHVRHVNLRSLGFAPLDTIIVTGTVGPRPNPQTLVIRANTIHKAASR